MQFNNMPGNFGIPMDPYNGGSFIPQQQMMTPPQQNRNPYGIGGANTQPQQMGMRPAVDPRTFETPTITMGETKKPLFTVAKDNPNSIKVDPEVPDVEKANRKKKKEGQSDSKKEVGGKLNIVRANEGPEKVNGEVVDSTFYTYQETNNLLHETLGQIDAINGELVQEFNTIRHNRTMKNKYNVLNSLSENIGSLISNRIATIKEINNCITKANDLDYKKYKDIQAAQSAMSDDKYIADLYQAFIQNPQNNPTVYQTPALDQSLVGSSIIRANLPGPAESTNGIIDEGYLSYVANLTPEQNLMRYENNPNVKQVVIYDAQTGNRSFQMMDMTTMEAIPNLPTYDEMILADCDLDLTNNIAKNLNLRESFPIVQINNSVTSQY